MFSRKYAFSFLATLFLCLEVPNVNGRPSRQPVNIVEQVKAFITDVIENGLEGIEQHLSNLQTRSEEFIEEATERIEQHVKKTQALLKQAKMSTSKHKPNSCFKKIILIRLGGDATQEVESCAMEKLDTAEEYAEEMSKKVQDIITPIKMLEKESRLCFNNRGCEEDIENEAIDYSRVLPEQVQQMLDDMFDFVFNTMKEVAECGNSQLKQLFISSSDMLQNLSSCVNNKAGQKVISFHISNKN